METGEIITLTAIMIGFLAVLISIFALMWQMHSQGVTISAKIEEQGGRLSEIEREQARLEGANGTLSQVLKQQSYTHEAGD